MNIEFVYLILVGINSYFEQLDRKPIAECQHRLEINQDMKSCEVIIKNVNVKNTTLWNVDKTNSEITSMRQTEMSELHSSQKSSINPNFDPYEEDLPRWTSDRLLGTIDNSDRE